MTATIYVGDCLEIMRGMPDASIDAIVTDPPYGIAFMGKDWDSDVPPVAVWAECLRVLKPGGHLLAFAGTRTQHRMATRIEDAGFEIRDMIAWVYGSGFPKSHNGPWGGTALKPALEPLTVARKPLVGTVAANVLAHGTGALNIDGCRVGTGEDKGDWPITIRRHNDKAYTLSPTPTDATKGRWPANLIHDGSDEVVELFPSEEGASASRFFYCAKPSSAERGRGNNHATVKPVDLMRYLVRLVTPAGGTVLDPFTGSGTTGIACVAEGFAFVGCELSPEHAALARRRITAEAPLFVAAKEGTA